MNKSVRFVLGQEQEQALYQLQKAITHTNILAYFKNNYKFRIATDASPVGLSAVLTQLQEGFWRAIAYAAKSLTNALSRYSQTEKETLAVAWACEKFNLNIFGKEFELETNHRHLFPKIETFYQSGNTGTSVANL